MDSRVSMPCQSYPCQVAASPARLHDPAHPSERRQHILARELEQKICSPFNQFTHEIVNAYRSTSIVLALSVRRIENRIVHWRYRFASWK